LSRMAAPVSQPLLPAKPISTRFFKGAVCREVGYNVRF
jgi:hypothetical protein